MTEKTKKVIRRILYVFLLILIVIMIKLLFNTIINSNVISRYENNEYLEEDAKKLLFANVFDKHIAHYNLGNIYYQKGDFSKAIEEYDVALKHVKSEEDDCKIRINKCLAMLELIDFSVLDNEYVEKSDIDNLIAELKRARKIITENGCANENDDKGHNKDAEKLKKDIDKKIKELENIKIVENKVVKKQDKEEEKDKKDDDKEEQLKEKLKENDKEAIKARKKAENNRDTFNQQIDLDINYDDKVW